MTKIDFNQNIFKIAGSSPYEASKVPFGSVESGSGESYSYNHGCGKAAGAESNGFIGYVPGTGKNGAHVLERLYA